MEETTKVVPISSDEDKRRAKEIEKEVERRERDVEKLEKMSGEYYGFFRLGGSLNLSFYKSLSDLERAAVASAKKKIRDEDLQTMMRLMVTAFDTAIRKTVDPDHDPVPEAPKGI
jgi:hypothetical protein